MELNKQDFENYLRGMEPEDIAGLRMVVAECPLANWSGCDVGPYGLIFWGSEPRHAEEMPAWAAQFVQAVDHGLDFEVTAKRCLEILEQIED